MGDRFRRLAALLAAATAALMLSPQLGAVTRLPDEMVLDAGAVTMIPVSSAVVADASDADGAIAEMETALEGGLRLTAGNRGEGRLTFSLLGLVPLRTVKLSVRPERVLAPGGTALIGGSLGTSRMSGAITKKMRERNPDWQPPETRDGGCVTGYDKREKLLNEAGIRCKAEITDCGHWILIRK